MPERYVDLDQPLVMDEQSEALRRATERAEVAEAALAKLSAQPATTASKHNLEASGGAPKSIPNSGEDEAGIEELRKDSMMAHLLDSLEAGKDIGHYGRLVFAMVARHFIPSDEVIEHLTHDRDFSQEQATLMLRQVKDRDYNPPKRERILEWQSQQAFPILPHPDDPDCGNLYRNLKFPEGIYDHISHYQEEKLHASDD